MLNWLKFIGGSFFSNKISKEGGKRSFWNVIFALLMFVILAISFYSTGYNMSFSSHYSNASEFKEFLYHAFANEDLSKRINVQVYEDGDEKNATKKVKAGFYTGELEESLLVDTYADSESEYLYNGYHLVIDTRPAATTFDDFTAYCVLKNDVNNLDERISYEHYLELSSDEQSNYVFGIEYGGKAIEFTEELIQKYTNHLNLAADKDSSKYNEDIAKAYNELLEKKSELSEYDYHAQLYQLYVTSYYPSMTSIETYSVAPTLRSYYLSRYQSIDENGDYSYKNYLLILDDLVIGSFENDKGISILFEGYYSSLTKDFRFTTTQTVNTLSSIQSNVDQFIVQSFNAASSWNTLVYGINVFRMIPNLLISILLCTLLVFAICRLSKQSYGYRFMGAFKIISSYLMVATLLSGFVSLILPFFLSREMAFVYSFYAVIIVLMVRTLFLVIFEFVRFKKHGDEEVILSSKKPNLAPASSSESNAPIHEETPKVDLSKVDSGTKVIVNDVDDDEDEKMELM